MNTWSIVFFILGALYLVAYFVEIPFFYEGNPKTKFMIQKMGKKNYKLLLLVFAVIFLVVAFLLK
ncbi:MAG TPA: hypothetical protein DCP62_05090 [Erysipelotrichaceae bacterium]|nr:hypothetical protein [Erysipelotrichaceae bacterium]OGS59683.1 MAG: hypothetical protein A2Y19_02045 [Firmicutes bacterium GWE2_51_13]HAM63032.1 hypothetical protein [Erysipelotrichaceae bacterium]HAO61802.1 hypothetical protein [Erysipelotrichaceae bacterium]HBZ42198.1 hypothetical protein [Erysipelotrichaceae bacterium]